MPNWAVGTLRVRGKREDIMAWLNQTMKYVAFHRLTDEEYEVPVRIEMHPDHVGMWHDAAPREYRQPYKYYIEGTQRNFVDADPIDDRSVWLDILELQYSDDVILLIPGFSAAWGVDAEPYAEMAKQHHLDFHIQTWECGMCFSQDIIIDRDTGEIHDNSVSYDHADDYIWLTANPLMGG